MMFLLWHVYFKHASHLMVFLEEIGIVFALVLSRGVMEYQPCHQHCTSRRVRELTRMNRNKQDAAPQSIIPPRRTTFKRENV